jgi:hypothetical protein
MNGETMQGGKNDPLHPALFRSSGGKLERQMAKVSVAAKVSSSPEPRRR